MSSQNWNIKKAFVFYTNIYNEDKNYRIIFNIICIESLDPFVNIIIFFLLLFINQLLLLFGKNIYIYIKIIIIK
jgi:hypothetical protein